MYGFASYDIVRARQTLVERRAAQIAHHGDAVRARRRGRTLRMQIRLAFVPTPAGRPACCAA